MKTSQWRLLRNPGFTLLWTAGLISITGNWLLNVALPIFIYQLTGSAAATATAVAARVAAGLLAAPLAGAYVDRWDRKRVMVVANLVQGVTLLPLLAVDTPGELWLAYLVIAVQAVMFSFTLPAEHALLPRLVAETDLPAANGLNALNNNLARLIGPALGGVVAVTLGLPGAVLLDAASFTVAAVLAALIPGAHRAVRAAPRHLLAEIAEGARVIARAPVVRALFAVIAVTAVGEGIMGSLFAVFVADALHGDARHLGWLMSAQAVGGVAGGLATGWVARRLSPRRLLAVGLILFGALDLALFNYPRWTAAFAPAVVLIMLVGVPAAIMGAAWFTMLQTHIGDGLRARVLSAVLVVEAAGGLFGALLAGLLTPRFGVIPVLTGQGAAYVLAALAFGYLIRRHRTVAAAEPVPARP